jgi:hypothetical protein
MASNNATATGSKPVGIVASSDGRNPYEAAASARIEIGGFGEVAIPCAEGDWATRATRLMRASFDIGNSTTYPSFGLRYQSKRDREEQELLQRRRDVHIVQPRFVGDGAAEFNGGTACRQLKHADDRVDNRIGCRVDELVPYEHRGWDRD